MRVSIFWGLFLLMEKNGLFPARSLQIRIVDLATFVRIHGSTPICRAIGFSPDSSLSQTLIKSVNTSKSSRLTWHRFPKFTTPLENNIYLGILPDIMHVCHLSLYPDAFCSVLLDLTDDQQIIPGNSRDSRLHVLWRSYRSWCEQGGPE